MTKVKKAVIPAAGLGTRLLPVTKVVPKVFLPVLSSVGYLIPVIQSIIEEAMTGGIERIAMIVSPQDEPFFRSYFLKKPSERLRNVIERNHGRGNPFEGLEKIAGMVDILIQEDPEGFGHAVAQAEEWVGNESFLLLLGDHIYRSHTAETCTAQLLKVAAELGGNAVGVSRITEVNLHKRGIVAGEPRSTPANTYRVRKIVEKPARDLARQTLKTPGLEERQYLAFFGNYVLQPEVFAILRDMIAVDRRYRGEIQLTLALDDLRASAGIFALEINGECYDMGNPEGYRSAFSALVRNS